jgi:protein TonB
VKKRPRTALFYVYVVSLLLHAGFAVSAILLPKPKRTATVAIQLAQAKKKKEPPKPPPPTPEHQEEKPKPKPAPRPEQQQAKVAPEIKPVAPPPQTGGNESFVETGIALGNSEGPGIAVPAAVAAAGPAAPTASATATHKVQQLAAPTQGANVCNDPVIKPKRKSLVTPKYTLEARQADIEGIIRVEVTVDESGRVASARILSGLGYGLDEAALAAAKQCTFEPATQCGKPLPATAVLPFRMQLE